jgi:hypothetical protein
MAELYDPFADDPNIATEEKYSIDVEKQRPSSPPADDSEDRGEASTDDQGLEQKICSDDEAPTTIIAENNSIGVEKQRPSSPPADDSEERGGASANDEGIEQQNHVLGENICSDDEAEEPKVLKNILKSTTQGVSELDDGGSVSLGRPAFLPARGPPDLLKPLDSLHQSESLSSSSSSHAKNHKKTHDKKRGSAMSRGDSNRRSFSDKRRPPPAPPAGFTVKFSERKGRWYWTNTSTQQSQWDLPSSSSGDDFKASSPATKKHRMTR